jgi:malonyl-CoA O-methyltransferase
VRAAFDKAADAYDAVASVQRAACDRLLALPPAQPPAAHPRRRLRHRLRPGRPHQRFPAAELIALDFAPAMLRRHPPGLALPLCADLEHLPLADASVDAIWSSYALQWCAPRRALPELARSLRPGGQLWIATLGPGTLHELRDAFRQVDDAEHVLPFQPPEVITAAEAPACASSPASATPCRPGPPTCAACSPTSRPSAPTRPAPRAAAPGQDRLGPAGRRLRGPPQPAGLPASYDTFWLIAEKRP